MEVVAEENRTIAQLDDPENPTVQYRFSRLDLAKLLAQLDGADLLILLSRLPSVVLVGCADVRVAPMKPGGTQEPTRTFPLVIQMSDQLEGNLGRGLLQLCQELYGVEPHRHNDTSIVLMVSQRRVLPPQKVDPALPENGG